jgi:hypothetical protein
VLPPFTGLVGDFDCMSDCVENGKSWMELLRCLIHLQSTVCSELRCAGDRQCGCRLALLEHHTRRLIIKKTATSPQLPGSHPSPPPVSAIQPLSTEDQGSFSSPLPVLPSQCAPLQLFSLPSHSRYIPLPPIMTITPVVIPM